MKDKISNPTICSDVILSELSRIDEKAEELSKKSFINSYIENKSFSEKLELARKVDSNDIAIPVELGDVSEDVDALIKAVTILDLVGMDNTSSKIRKYIYKVAQYRVLESRMVSYISEYQAGVILAERNRNNASGPRNIYYDEALKIMIDTWAKYPTASKNGMKAKIIKYFGLNRHDKDKVSDSSVKRWIKENKLGPTKGVKPITDFDLVIGS